MPNLLRPLLANTLAILVSLACPPSTLAGELFASTYQPPETDARLFVDVHIYSGTGVEEQSTQVLIVDGKIQQMGTNIIAPAAQVIDGGGRWLTPGIIDVHSHMGDYPAPAIAATRDGNEATAPNTARVWAEHSVWPQDPQFELALAGGITTLQVLPGSANLFGGRGVTLKNVASRTVQGMKYPGAKQGLKMACGENPKRVYGSKGQAPSTRMGNVAGYREAWAKATDYQRKVKAHEQDATKPLPDRDLTMETLVGVLEGEIIVHNHCYRADEMANMIDVAREFGYQIGTFHHAVESYKFADQLAQENICSAMWADWWGSKLELFDGVQQNVALVHNAGACAIVHSDSAYGIQRLNQEAAKALAAGQRMGLDITKAEAIRWITMNAAKSLQIDQQTGSIEIGKAADLVVWNQDPLSVYALADLVFIDGHLYFDRSDPNLRPVSDFALGLSVEGQHD
ncbi:MAG: amidohydrolase [Pseudomonadales bacterium]|jgi:imidazolonepropionase-like amidohydrolase|nr:amidohydrolase [Pseudomonadales bacterium]